MDYSATAKYLRVSTRKARLVADSIRKLTPAAASMHLTILPKHAGKSLADVIQSAIANAKAKHADEASLRFKAIEVMGGQVMKRWHAVSKGQAHAYKKRMTHIKVVLTDEVPTLSSISVRGGSQMST